MDFIKRKKFIFLLSFFVCCTFFISDGFTNAESKLTDSFSKPVKILANAQNGKLFILNLRDNKITILSENTHQIIANISTGGEGSSRESMDSDGNLYILNQTSKNITIFPKIGSKNNFDDESISNILKERSLIPLGSFSPEQFFAPDFDANKVYLIDKKNKELGIFNTQTKDFQRIFLGNTPSSLYVYPLAHKIYIANDSNGHILVIDGNSGEITGEITIDSVPPFNFQLIKDNKLLIISKNNNKIYVLDSNNNIKTTMDSGGLGPTMSAVNNTTDRLYISNWLSGNISLFDLKNYKFVKNISLSAGDFPKFINVNQESNLLFLTTMGTNKAVIIDGEQNKIIAEFNTGVNPGDAVMHPKTKEIYIPNSESDSITIISMDQDGQFKEETIPNNKNIVSIGSNFSYPIKMAINEENNDIYILNNLGGSLIIVDGKNYQIKKNISVGNNPKDIVYVSEINEVFITVSDDDKIFVYNVVNDSQRTISTGDKPSSILFDEQNKNLYSINYGEGDIDIIDIEKGVVIKNIPLGNRAKIFTLDNKDNKIYVAGIDNEIIIIDARNNEIIKTISVDFRPEYLLFDDNYNSLYITESGGCKISVLSTDSEQIKNTFCVEDTDSISSITKDNFGNIYLSTNNGIKIIDPINLQIKSSNDQIGINSVGIILDQDSLFVLNEPSKELGIANINGSSHLIIPIFQFSNFLKQNAQLSKFKDLAFNSQTNKLFILTIGPDSLAIVNTKNNRLEAVVSNEGVEKIKYPINKNIQLIILFFGGVIVFGSLAWFIFRKPKNSNNNQLISHS